MPLDPEDYKHRFAFRLREARDAAGLTQAQAGMRVGLTQGEISKIEKGERPVHLHRAIALADLYGTSISELIRAVRDSHGVPEDERRLLNRAFFGSTED